VKGHGSAARRGALPEPHLKNPEIKVMISAVGENEAGSGSKTPPN
jgi:hypothetical protein